MTDMTQAPTPGPLSGDDVKPGDLLRHERGLVIVRMVEPDVGLHVGYAWTDGVQLVDIFENFAFIGRPAADGWMPWSGGENLVPGQTVRVRFPDGSTFAGLSDGFSWDWLRETASAGDIIAFHFAPAAPVEASGSEHITDELKSNDIAAILEENADADADGLHNASQLAQKIYYRMKELRPETREAVARIIHRNEFEGQAWEDATEAYRQHVLKTASDILALRPAPVASGCQKGEVPADIVAACKRLKEAARSHRCENGSTVAGADMLAVTSYVLKGPQS